MRQLAFHQWTVALALSLILVGVGVAGCGDGPGPTDAGLDGDTDSGVDGDVEVPVPSGCNPLAPEWDCLLPYPSDVFLVTDSSLPGGRRIDHGSPGLPIGSSGPVELVDSRPADGFSRVSNILALFPGGVDDSALVFHDDDLDTSTTAASPTALLDLERGELVAHFAELDPRANDAARQALVIHPLRPLRFGARYVVAISGLRDPEGELIEAPSGFARLRDGEAEGEPSLSPLVERYEDELFPALEAAGLVRQELQLAWDFTVASRANRAGDLLALRELALEALAASPPVFTVSPEQVEDDVDEHIARRVEGTIEVPMYLESTDFGAALVRDEAGEIQQNGTVDVDVLVSIPRSVAEGEERQLPGRLVQYGHGFFGTRAEIDKAFPRRFADETATVLAAVDWWGMAEADRLPIGSDIFEDLGRIFRFTDRVHQAMVNQLALSIALQSTMTEAPELAIDGELAYAPEALYFYGISNGHILGSTFVGLSPVVDRAALSSGGCDLSLIMFRSMPFGALLWMIEMVMEDPLDIQKFAAMGQVPLDRIEPATYLDFLVDEPLPGAPESRRLLVHAGIGDPYVPNLATELYARALELPLLAPAPRPVWGLDEAPGPIDGSALMEIDFHEPEPLPGTFAETPSEDNGIHQAARATAAAITQVDRFFRPDGAIEAVCDGPCDPD